MMYSFVILGPVKSLNDYVNQCRRNYYAANSMIQTDEQRAIIAIRSSTSDRVKKPVKITYNYFCQGKRMDKDNIAGYFHKFFQDALVKSHFLEDDKWDNIVGFEDRFTIDKKNPRVEVIIEEVDG